MKKKIAGLLLTIVLLLRAHSSLAFAVAYEMAYNEIPISPVINIAHDIIEAGKSGLSAATQVTTMAINIKKSAGSLLTAINSILSALGININIGNRVQLKGVVCNAKINKVNTTKLAQKMRDVFLVYRKAYQRDMVSNKRREFYLDNIYNMYAMVKTLQAIMSDKGNVGKAIAKTKACMENDKTMQTVCGIGGTKDNSNDKKDDDSGEGEKLRFYNYTLQTLNDVIKIWERTSALKAQFRALQSFMRMQIYPKYDYSDKVSFLYPQEINLPIYHYNTHSSTELASAQVAYKEAPNVSLKNTVAQPEENAPKVIEDNVNTDALGMHFTVTNISSPVSALEENADKLDVYGDLGEVETIVQKAIDAHNFVGKLDTYRSNAEQYRKMQERYAKKLQQLLEADNCGIKYTSRYFKSPEITWSGKKFSLQNVNQYESRKGITAWAIDAYDVAKAAQTNVSTDDKDGEVDYSTGSSFGANDVEVKTVTNDELFDVSEGENWDKSEKFANELNEGDDGSKMSASSLHKTQDENRNASLISWQIGAEAAKMLGSEPAKWGTPSSRKMIWNDTKVFYNQYLDRKYDNIKAYLKRYTKEDVIDIFISKLQNIVLDINQTDYQNALNTNRDTAAAEIVAILSQTENVDSGIPQEMLDKKKNLVANIDNLSAQIKDLEDEISDLDSLSKSDAEQSMTSDILKAPDLSEDNLEPVKPFNDPSTNSKEMSQKISASLEKGNMSALKAQEKILKEQRDQYNKELQELEKQMKQAKLEAQSQRHGVAGNSKNGAVANALNGFTQATAQAYSAYKSALEDRFNAALAVVAAGNPEVALAMKLGIEGAAQEVVESINSAIDGIVDSTKSKILALGDELYLPSSSSQIASIHQEMIDQLKALTIAKSVMGYSIEGMIAFAELADFDASPETEGFFVGALPRARDLKAPHPLKDYSQPPLREVFHFDLVDFANIKPYNTALYRKYQQLKTKLKNPLISSDKKEEARNEMQKLKSISRKEFLSVGSEIPKIWKVMLQDNAFIETQFRLADALNQGCEVAGFLRGGVFPCKVAETKTVLDINIEKKYDEDAEKNIYSFDMQGDEYIERKDLNPDNLPKCLYIKMKKNKPYHALFDEKVSTPSFFDNLSSHGDPVETDCKYSELGVILDADANNNIFFKDVVYETFNNSLAADDKDDDDLKAKDKNQMALARHAELAHNQMGSFLEQMEQEKKFKQSLDKTKESYEKSIAELKGKLQEFGFTVADDYDIVKDNDYNLTISRLKEAQENEIKNALNSISLLNIENNEAAQERLGVINKVITVMRQDKDCVMEMSLMSADDNTLDEKLKSSKANKKARDKFNDKVKKEMSKDEGGEEYVYCANY